MRFSSQIPALLAVGICLALPLQAQDDAGAPPPPQPSPENGPYVPPPDQTGPVPDQGAPQAPDQGATFQTFYDSLGAQGNWVQSPDYGYVWQPSVNDPDWAPYTNGHWVYSDAGWTWASAEPWGWATYHYGRWVNLQGTGWCWVPGYTWAPAWVSWRYGNGYCGWAPLPPDSFVGIDYSSDGIQIIGGFHIGGDCDSYYGIGAGCYTFLPVNCLGYSSYHGYYAQRYNNFAIINHTTNVTNLNVNRNPSGQPMHNFTGVTTGGPSLAQVNAVSATPVQRVNLVNASQPGGGRLANNSLALYAPRVNASNSVQPTHVAGTLGQTSINRGVDVTQPLAVNRSLAAPALTQPQIQQAQIAQYHAPVSAKVVTPDAQSQPVLQAPLVSLKPISAGPQTTTPVVSPYIQHVTVSQSAVQPVTHGYSYQENNAPQAYVPGTAYPQTSSYNRQVQPSPAPAAATSGGTPVHSTAPQGNTYYHQTQPAPSSSSSGSSTQSAPPATSPTPFYSPSSGNNNNQGGGNSGGQQYHNSSGGNGGGNGWGNHGGQSNQQNH